MKSRRQLRDHTPGLMGGQGPISVNGFGSRAPSAFLHTQRVQVGKKRMVASQGTCRHAHLERSALPAKLPAEALLLLSLEMLNYLHQSTSSLHFSVRLLLVVKRGDVSWSPNVFLSCIRASPATAHPCEFNVFPISSPSLRSSLKHVRGVHLAQGSKPFPLLPPGHVDLALENPAMTTACALTRCPLSVPPSSLPGMFEDY